MLMARDGLNREESCGGHFRTEYQTPEGEALRDDKNFSYVACWKYTGENSEPELIKEDLNYQFVKFRLVTTSHNSANQLKENKNG